MYLQFKQDVICFNEIEFIADIPERVTIELNEDTNQHKECLFPPKFQLTIKFVKKSAITLNLTKTGDGLSAPLYVIRRDIRGLPVVQKDVDIQSIRVS